MQTSSGDSASAPQGEAVEESHGQMPVEETVVETTPKSLTATLEEQPTSEKEVVETSPKSPPAKMEEPPLRSKAEDDDDQKHEKEETTAPPRKERSVMFADMPQAASEFLKKEFPRISPVQEGRVVTETLQPMGSLSLLRKLTSDLFSIPLGFFQSRAEVRTWGEERLVDPSVQPRCPATAHYGWGSLPNYPKSSLLFLQPSALGTKQPQFYSLAPKGGYRPASGVPLLHFVPGAVKIPQVTPLKPPSYNWNDLKEYRMDTAPYVNARMAPVDPTGMYVGGNYLVGYPYGVPAVEENEAEPLMATIPKTCKCNFLCW